MSWARHRGPRAELLAPLGLGARVPSAPGAQGHPLARPRAACGAWVRSSAMGGPAMGTAESRGASPGQDAALRDPASSSWPGLGAVGPWQAPGQGWGPAGAARTLRSCSQVLIRGRFFLEASAPAEGRCKAGAGLRGNRCKASAGRGGPAGLGVPGGAAGSPAPGSVPPVGASCSQQLGAPQPRGSLPRRPCLDAAPPRAPGRVRPGHPNPAHVSREEDT